MHAAFRHDHDARVSHAPGSNVHHLQEALRLLQPSLRKLNTRRLTFMCGAGGPLSMAAYLYHLLGDFCMLR